MAEPPSTQIWSGSISFGLVNVPVAMVAATRPMDFRFRELHRPDLAPVERRRFCEAEGIEVESGEIGRGYDLGEGRMVVLTEEELESVAPRRTRTIEIESFVDPGEIGPIHFDRSYYVVPTGDGEGDRRAYRLLVEAMEGDGHAAVGRFVMRTREHLVAIRARDSVLCLTTLHFAAEVRSAGDVPTGEAASDDRMVDDAAAVIEELSTTWDPDSYEDCYRERLGRVIEEKRRGRTAEPPTPAEEVAGRETAAPDLMSALKETLQEARSEGSRRKRRSPSGQGPSAAEPSREDLYRRAQEAGLQGRSKMTKEELRDALGEDG